VVSSKAPGQLKLRLVQPEYTIATSDGIRNGTREMRYSLIGRELTNDALCEQLSATGLTGIIAVVACDKPPRHRSEVGREDRHCERLPGCGSS